MNSRIKRLFGDDLVIWLALAAGIYFIGIMFGLTVHSNWLNNQVQSLVNSAKQVQGLSTLGIFFFILRNNLTALLYSFLLGPVFLLFPIFAMFENGAILSLVGLDVTQNHSVLVFFAGILPHGIIEIPAFVIGAAASMSFGFTLIRGIFRAAHRSDIGPSFSRNLIRLGIAALMLVPAAFIEAFVTPLAIKAAGG